MSHSSSIPPRLPAENITIEGNDEPLISGLQQNITCIFSGQNNVSLIEWVAVVEDFATKDTSGARVLLLTLTPTLDSDGSQFKCSVTDSSGGTYEETITISVKSKFTRNIHAHTHLKGELANGHIHIKECSLFVLSAYTHHSKNGTH